jgi:hypothetical protein
MAAYSSDICCFHTISAKGGSAYGMKIPPRSGAGKLHAEHVADVHVFKTDAPVTWESNGSPILDFSSMTAADFVTCRSTFFAASSSSVQCLASAANSSFS